VSAEDVRHPCSLELKLKLGLDLKLDPSVPSIPTRPASQLARLQKAASQAEDSLSARFAQIKLAAATGSSAAAHAQLAALYQENVDLLGESESFYREMVQSLMALGQFSAASRLTRAHLACTGAWDCGIDPDSKLPPNSVLWTVHERTRSSFLFSPDLYSISNTEMVIHSWLSCLPALIAYETFDKHRCGRIAISLGDHGVTPGLAFSDFRKEYFLIPDPQYLSTHGYREVAEAFIRDDIPWNDRRPVAFWRGATTGRYPKGGAQNWHDLPRARLCALANRHSDLFDAGFHRVVQMQNYEVIREIEASGLMRAALPETDFNRYKYHIDIDGNSNSWAGLFIKLLTGSPVIKVSSPLGFRQWYYDRLEPWVHFVPVASDLSDLIERTEWLRDNPGRAQNIGEQGQKLAMSLSYESEVARSSATIASAFEFFPNSNV
jgi:hypothetical protein